MNRMDRFRNTIKTGSVFFSNTFFSKMLSFVKKCRFFFSDSQVTYQTEGAVKENNKRKAT